MYDFVGKTHFIEKLNELRVPFIDIDPAPVTISPFYGH